MSSLLQTAQFMAETLRLDAAAPPPPPSGLDWPLLAHHADGHSLTPLLFDTWQPNGRLDAVPPEVRARLARAHADNTRRNQNIRAELLDIHRILSAAGVPHLVLKGWPLAEQLYASPAQRVLYDHDFLVPPQQAEVGHRALLAAGFVPLPAKDEWVTKHLPPLWRNNGYQWDGYLFDPDYPRPVELHVELWETGWRGLDVRPLVRPWANARAALVAGAPMQLLSRENTLVHLTMHFAGHLIERDARLNQLLDLARFVWREWAALDWAQVLAQAGEAGVARFVFASLALAHRIFAAPQPPPRIWQQLAAQTPAAFKEWLARQGPADVLTGDYRRAGPGQDYRLTFLAANSLRERAGIARFALLPPRTQLAQMYGLRRPALAPLYYPRFVLNRLNRYRRGFRRG
ncbi:MAG: hypothetical protein FOGNACKC_01009 [Anaerolineae bacterium]|nr:hypothetical protein [Anaerolineae bacterium]